MYYNKQAVIALIRNEMDRVGAKLFSDEFEECLLKATTNELAQQKLKRKEFVEKLIGTDKEQLSADEQYFNDLSKTLILLHTHH